MGLWRLFWQTFGHPTPLFFSANDCLFWRTHRDDKVPTAPQKNCRQRNMIQTHGYIRAFKFSFSVKLSEKTTNLKQQKKLIFQAYFALFLGIDRQDIQSRRRPFPDVSLPFVIRERFSTVTQAALITYKDPISQYFLAPKYHSLLSLNSRCVNDIVDGMFDLEIAYMRPKLLPCQFIKTCLFFSDELMP